MLAWQVGKNWYLSEWEFGKSDVNLTSFAIFCKFGENKPNCLVHKTTLLTM